MQKSLVGAQKKNMVVAEKKTYGNSGEKPCNNAEKTLTNPKTFKFMM